MPQPSFFSWPYYPLLFSDSDHPISKGLDAIKCEFVSSIDTIKNKINKKKYWHTGYPGGIKNKTIKEILESKNSTSLLRNCVKNMLKKGTLGKEQLKNLYIYSNKEHPHVGQKPIELSLN